MHQIHGQQEYLKTIQMVFKTVCMDVLTGKQGK